MPIDWLGRTSVKCRVGRKTVTQSIIIPVNLDHIKEDKAEVVLTNVRIIITNTEEAS